MDCLDSLDRLGPLFVLGWFIVSSIMRAAQRARQRSAPTRGRAAPSSSSQSSSLGGPTEHSAEDTSYDGRAYERRSYEETYRYDEALPEDRAEDGARTPQDGARQEHVDPHTALLQEIWHRLNPDAMEPAPWHLRAAREPRVPMEAEAERVPPEVVPPTPPPPARRPSAPPPRAAKSRFSARGGWPEAVVLGEILRRRV